MIHLPYSDGLERGVTRRQVFLAPREYNFDEVWS
jgi:hypothetical protein